MKKGGQHKSGGQLMWGIALVLVGMGVFVRIPQVMPKLAEMEQFVGVTGYIRFCLYLMGIILVGGGVKKVVLYMRSPAATPQEQFNDNSDG
jgi:cytochrome b561